MMPKVKRLTGKESSLLQQMAALERRCFPDPWSQEMFTLEAARKGGLVLAAVDEQERLLGFLTASYVMDTADLTNIAVHPERRQKGIGAMLMQRMLEELDAGTQIFLEVRVSNAPAIALYERFGFRQVGTRKRYYDHPVEDALLMQYGGTIC